MGLLPVFQQKELPCEKRGGGFWMAIAQEGERSLCPKLPAGRAMFDDLVATLRLTFHANTAATLYWLRTKHRRLTAALDVTQQLTANS